MRTAQTTTLSIHGLVSTSKTTGSKVGVHVAYGGIRKGGARPKEGSIIVNNYVHVCASLATFVSMFTKKRETGHQAGRFSAGQVTTKTN